MVSQGLSQPVGGARTGTGYRYYLNGQLLPLSESIEAIPGAAYTVQIKLANGNGNTPSYQLDVAFK